MVVIFLYRLKKLLIRLTLCLPSDVRTALIVFSAFCLVAVCIIPLLSEEQKTDVTAIPSPINTGLEPYIAYVTAGETDTAGDSDELSEELLCLFVEEKAGGMNYAARVSYAAVILNRVRSSLFGDSVSAVIRASDVYPSLQYSDVSARTKNAVRDALLGADPTFGALYAMHRGDKLYGEEYASRLTAAYGDILFLR